MAVVIVLTAVNDSVLYTQCADPFVRNWEKVNVGSSDTWVPVILRVSDTKVSLRLGLESFEWSLPTRDMPTSLVAQVSRLLAPAYVKADYVVTTDIDMLPLSLKVLEKSIRQLDRGLTDFVICRDVLKSKQFPICYNIASPNIWSQIFPDKFEHQLSQIWKSIQLDFDGRRGKKGWYFDQEYLYQKISEAEKGGIRVLRFKDEDTGHHRLDVNRRNKALWPVIGIHVLMGKYTDFHLRLPISKHNFFVNYILILNRVRTSFFKTFYKFKVS
jgi:hypothetical protein